MKPAPTVLLSTALALASLHSGQSAQVDLARNPVTSGTSRINTGSSLAPGSPIVTGSKAKTQISLGGNGSIVRAGSKTEAVLRNETNLTLSQGVMLTSSGQRTFGREAVSVETPETKSTVKGTMLVAYQPKTFIKITCIEGEATVKLKALMGEFVTLDAGQMVIINPAEKRLPEEVEVDLDELNRTSALLGGEFPPLAVAPKVTRAIDRQARGINEGDAIRTQLVLPGAGLEVTLSGEQGIEARREPPTVETEPVPPVRQPPPPPTHSPPTAPPYEPPPMTGPEYIIDETTAFFPSVPSLQTPGYPTVAGVTNVESPTLWEFHNLDPSRAPELLIRGEVDLPSTSSFAGDAYIADGVLQVGDGGITSVALSGPVTLGASQGVMIDSSDIFTFPDGSSGLLVTSDQRVDIRNSIIDQSSHVDVYAPSITVDNSALSAGAGGLRLTAPSGGAGIVVRNSSELLSMAARAGVALMTDGSPIAISDSQLGASDILIDASGPSGTSPGTVDIRNSIFSADTIRARAFDTAGRNALVIDGSRFNANNTIKFYAEGTSALVFRGNNILDLSASDGQGRAILAGRRVEVEAGGVVDVRGNLDVYRDVGNYNQTGFGRINATGQQSHQPFDSRPGF